MVIECVYCGEIIDHIGTATGTSHGVCSDCLPKILDELEIPLVEFLENIPYPAVLVSEKGRVIAKNSHYREAIHIDPHAIELFTGEKGEDTAEELPSQDSAIIKIVDDARKSGRDSWEVRTRAGLGNSNESNPVEVLMGAKRIGPYYIIGIEGVSDSNMS